MADSDNKLPPKIWVISIGLILLAASAGGVYGWHQYTHRPEPAPDNNNYEQPASYPQSTDEFVLQARELYSDPMNGIGLRYVAKADNRLRVDINMYPVGALSWTHNPNLLDDEADVILADMDYLISQGQWQRRFDVIRESITINGEPGLRLHFKLQQGKAVIYKMVYLFVQQDKYVKFTQDSADVSMNALVKSESAVKNLLTHIHAPPESPYAFKVRQIHLEKMRQKAQEILKNSNLSK